VANPVYTSSWRRQISKTAQVGHTALLAHVIEPSPEDEVEAEIAEAQEAQREAKKQARKQLRDARFKKNRDEAHEKVEELKAKLHGDRKPATMSA
jgi:ketol-acid reductoisomerase